MEDLFWVTSNGRRISYDASINRNTVVLFSSDVGDAEELKVAFVYYAYCRITLYSVEGLPARSAAPMKVSVIDESR